ncbi:potassium voltage-gated channel protein Shaw-like [Ruditapes philippinarum]|uniref:potassium voltage-gated channel protein Shaw-like n=1 Tax=Ruditapes philippinarum TaxID=129788 RepID=UPI00295B2CF2|nr:potassium voltage-gated channel protein Shaw-like [Ruditapes philippinarum]
MANQRLSDTVTLSVGSVLFKTTRSLLKTFDGTLLSNLDELSTEFDARENVYYFDRDPELFRHILNSYRLKEVHIPRTVCPLVFKKEMEFWSIPIQMIAPCCWQYLYESENNLADLNIVMNEDNDYKKKWSKHNHVIPGEKDVATSAEMQDGTGQEIHKKGIEENGSRRSKIWLFLEEPASSTAAKVWYYFYIFVVLVSVVLYLIWLVPSVRVSRYLSTLDQDSIDVFSLNSTAYEDLQKTYNEKIMMAGGTDPHPVLLAVDVFCIVFFAFELLLTVSVCPNKKAYFCDIYNLIKVIVCLCMTITVVMEINKDILKENNRVAHFMMACRGLASLRLLLIFRLRKIFNSLHIMLVALKHSLKELMLLLFTFLVLVVIYACLIFSAEIESDMFPNTQLTMWWAVITMTTVGYGDFYPVSTFGYILGVVCAINGIIVLALPIAAIAGVFSNLFSRNSEFQRHKKAVRDDKGVLTAKT